MKTLRTKYFIEKIFSFLFVSVIFLSTFFGNMKNIQADTDMRESISGSSDSGTTIAPEKND